MIKNLKRMIAGILIFSCILNINPDLVLGQSEDAKKEDITNTESLFGENIEIKESNIEETQKYILDNIDKQYANPIKLEWADAITVKHTFADKKKMPKDNLTLDGLWVSQNEEDWHGDAFITMNTNAVVMYDTDEDSKYYVAYINPMANDRGIETTDYTFAMNDNNANVYSDCIYDNKTGLAYIPKSHTLDIEGAVVKGDDVKHVKGALFMSQVQLLHLIKNDDEYTDIKVSVVSDIDSSNNIEGLSSVNIIDVNTVINLTDDKEIMDSINIGDISVFINGEDIEYEDYGYDPNTGDVIIPLAPSTVDSIKIVVSKPGIIEKITNSLKKVFNPTVHAADNDYFGITWAKKSRVLPYTWTFDGEIKELKALKGDTLKINADDSDKNKWSLYNDIGHPSPDIETGEVYKYLANGYWYQSGISYTQKNDEYSFSYGKIPSEDTVDNWLAYHSKQNNVAKYIASASGAPSKSTLISNLTNVGGKDSDLTNNYGLLWYGAEVPAEFKLKDNDGNVTNWTSTPKSSANNSTVQHKSTKNLIFPLQCAHIESPLGQDNGTDATHKLFFKLIDYNLDEETGEGIALIGIVGQTGTKKDANGNTVSSNQTPVGVSMVFLETSVLTPSPVSVKKSSSSHEATNGINSYSFEGITYKVYTNSTCTTEALDVNGYSAVITLNRDGNTVTPVNLTKGKYWIKEVNANTGKTQYKKNDEVKAFSVGEDGDEVIINFSDPPVHGPISIQKHDYNTGKTTAQGNASFEGVEFTLDYWDEIMPNDSLVNKAPKHSWVFRTDANGFVDCCNMDYFFRGTINPIIWSDENNGGNNIIDYPSGTYALYEIKSSHGYKISSTPVVGRIYGDDNQTVHNTFKKNASGNIEFREKVIRGGVEVTLRDVEYPSEVRSQGDGTLKGATFGIYNRSKMPITFASNSKIGNPVNGNYSYQTDNEDDYTASGEYAPVGNVDDGTTPFLVITTNEYGYATTGRFALPTGEYTIRQLTPPEGYMRTGKSKLANVDNVYQRDFTIGGKDSDNGELLAGELSDHGKMVTVEDCLNPTIRGGVKVVKEDIELLFKKALTGEAEVNSALGNNGHDNEGLNDVEFSIWNISSKNPDPDGYPRSNLVNAYVDNTFIKAKDLIGENYIDEQGNPSYEKGKEVLKRQNATSNTKWSELINNFDGGYVCTIKTKWDENEQKYIARTYGTPGLCLPYGTYLIAETKTNPSGKYILSDRSVFTFEVRNDGQTVSSFSAVNGGITNATDPTTDMLDDNTIGILYKSVNGDNTVSYTRDGSITSFNRIKRTDITLKKKASDSTNTLQVAFLLTNNSTDEKHVLVLNENGQGSTSINTGGYQYSNDERDILFPEHTRRTNANDALYFATNPDGSIDYESIIYDPKNPINVEDFDTKAGIWFGLSEDGVSSIANDALCALPWGEYTLEELRCNTNVDYKLSIETLDLKNYKSNPNEENSISSKDDVLKTTPTIRKSVITDYDSEDAIQKEDVHAVLKDNENYKYRLYVTADDNDIKNISITDFIEQADTDILGSIEYVDTSYVESLGFGAEVYYSQTIDDWSESLTDSSTGIRVDLDGVLKKHQTIYVDVIMKAPVADEKLFADNFYTLEYSDIIYKNNDKEPNTLGTNYIEEDGEPINSNKTRVIISPKLPPSIVKSVIKDNNEGISAELESNDTYKYRLNILADNQDIKDIVITDYIEQKNTEKIGYILGVDTGFASSKGFVPSLSYIHKEEDGSLSYDSNTKDSVGIKISLNGVLKARESVYIDVLMKAPFSETEATAKNTFFANYSYILEDNTVIPGDEIESNETQVHIVPGLIPEIEKQIIKGGVIGTEADLDAEDKYIYRLNVKSNDARIKDFIIEDFIEHKGSTLIGEIESVDMGNIISKGLIPMVLYTEKENPTEADWSQIKTKKTIGIRIVVKGELNPNELIYADINMKAKAYDKTKKAYNEFILRDYGLLNPDGSFIRGNSIISNPTKVVINPFVSTKEIDKDDDKLNATKKTDEKSVNPKANDNATPIGESIGQALGVSPKTGDGIALLIALAMSMLLLSIGILLKKNKKEIG